MDCICLLSGQLVSCNASPSCSSELEAAASTLDGGLVPDASGEMQALFACVVTVLQSETVDRAAIGG